MLKNGKSKTKKLLLSLAAVGVAASIAGLGTYATFTDTASTTSDPTISTGTVDINLGAEGTADNRLSVGASGLVPGDSLQRRAKLTNAGNQNLASVVLTTSASASSLLTTDATNGLQMKIEKCTGTIGWTESIGAPYTYTCDAAVPADNLGVRSTVLASRAIIGADLALTGMSSLTAAGSDDMVVTVTLPSTADNTFQGLSSTIDYTFSATQRAATNK